MTEIRKILTLTFFFFCIVMGTYAQFGVPEEVCPANTINFESPQPGVHIHHWDFCTGDLLETPVATQVSNEILTARTPEGIDVVFDGEKWYGFITSRENNTIIRADFGNSLDNIPSYVNIGNPDFQLNKPIGISIIKQGGKWYAFVINIANTPQGKVVRLDFGSSLTNSTITTKTFIFPDMGYPEIVDAKYDNGKCILIVGAWVSGIHVINFGNSFANNSSTIKNRSFSNNNNARIVRVIKHDNQWYGLAGSPYGGVSNNKNILYFMEFGTSLDNVPTLTQITDNIDINGGKGNLYDIRIAKDGKQFVAFLMTDNRLIRLDFGEHAKNLNPVTTDLGNFGQLQQVFPRGPTLCFDIIKHESQYYIFSVNRTVNASPNKLARLKFPEKNCLAEDDYSSVKNPNNKFLKSGDNVVILDLYDEDLNPIANYIDQFKVKEEVIAAFIAINQCVGQPTTFQNNSVGDLTGVDMWEWNFGDGSALSNIKEPEHTYQKPGIYTAKLKVVNKSGCENEIIRKVRIINQPDVDFEVKVPRCVNQEVIFTNVTKVDPISKNDPEAFYTTYWNYGGTTSPPSITPNGINDGKFTYTSAGTYNVNLTLNDFYNAIPPLSCTGTITKKVTIGEFPVSDFENDRACANVPTQFTDMSTISGSIGNEIKAWHWTFSNQGTSSLQNPKFAFNAPGTYDVTLTVKSSCDCEHTITKQVEVKQSLETNFESSVINGTAPLTVSFSNKSLGASSFVWNFGDGNTSIEESPTYTFTNSGTYKVSFQAKNAINCGTIKEQIIKVDAPAVDIAVANLKIQEDNTSAKIKLDIKNKSNVVINAIDFELDLGNTTFLREGWSGSLNPQQIISYTFQKSISSSLAKELRYICVDASLKQKDVNIFDNSVCLAIDDTFDFISISPNPAVEEVQIEYYVPNIDSPLKTEVISESGAIVSSQAFNATREGLNTLYYNISNLKNGLYFVRIYHEGNFKVRKLLIKR